MEKIKKENVKTDFEESAVFYYFYMIGVLFTSEAQKLVYAFKNRVGSFHTFVKKKIVKIFAKIFAHLKNRWQETTSIFINIGINYKKAKKVYLNPSSKTYNLIIPLYISIMLNIFKALGYLMNKLLRILLPIAAILFFSFTINYYLSLKRVIQINVSYGEDKNYVELGYIENEGVFEAAEKSMQRDIRYDDNKDYIYTIPKFSIKHVKKDETIKILNPEELRESIITNSGREIIEAWGLYIDDVFFGAIENPTKIKATLNSLLEPYKTKLDNEEITFHQTVKLEDNIYLKSSLKTEEEIITVLTSQREEQEIYVVKKGDYPVLIAETLGVTLEELMILNPDLYDKLIVGTELVTKEKKDFLSIQKDYYTTHEISISYEKEVIENASKNIGFFEVSQEGKDGTAEIRTKITTVDAKQTEKEEVSRIILKNPVSEKKVVGTRTYVNGKYVNVDPNNLDIGTGQFLWPVESIGKITCAYGCYYGHRAVDIQSFYGDYTLAADDGVVTKAVYQRYGYGYHVEINHLNGYSTLYAHHSELLVKVGDVVKKGQRIARQGNTGNVRGITGIHLHFEIIYDGVQQNPKKYLGY